MANPKNKKAKIVIEPKKLKAIKPIKIKITKTKKAKVGVFFTPILDKTSKNKVDYIKMFTDNEKRFIREHNIYNKVLFNRHLNDYANSYPESNIRHNKEKEFDAFDALTEYYTKYSKNKEFLDDKNIKILSNKYEK